MGGRSIGTGGGRGGRDQRFEEVRGENGGLRIEPDLKGVITDTGEGRRGYGGKEREKKEQKETTFS